MKTAFAVVLAAVMLSGCAGSGQTATLRQPDPLTSYVQGLVGNEVWLRIGMVRIQFLGSGKDFTNVMPDGNVLYKGIVKGFQASQATTVEGIEREITRKGTSGHVRVLEPGTKATVTRANLDYDGLKIEITAESGYSMGLSLKRGQAPRTVETFERLFSVAFAWTAADAVAPEVSIEIGMSIEDVLAVKGSPTTRVNLGDKTILTYPDVKLIFEAGKLTDAE